MHIDPDGGWIPGVDSKGNIILTAEDGDNAQSLMKFFGTKKNAENYLSTQYTKNTAQIFKVGNVVTLKESNYSKALKDVINQPKKYGSRSENPETPVNYNCHIAGINGALEEDFGEDVRMEAELDMNIDLRDDVVKNCFEPSNPETAVFGRSIVTMGHEHTAAFFGRSKDGTVYIFSKDGKTQAPTITPVIDKVKHRDNNGTLINYGFGAVRGIVDYDGNTLNSEIDTKTGQKVDNTNPENSGYYNLKGQKNENQ